MNKIQSYHFTEDARLVMLEVVNRRQIIEKLEVIVEKPGIECNVEFVFIILDDVKMDLDLTARLARGMKRSAMHISIKIIKVGNSSSVTLNPNMEVNENELEASHGLTIGEIDENQVNYLASRGLKINAAKIEILKGMVTSIQGISNERRQKAIEDIQKYYTEEE